MIQEIYRGWRMQLFDKKGARELPGDEDLRRFLALDFHDLHLRCISPSGRIISYSGFDQGALVERGRGAINRMEDKV